MTRAADAAIRVINRHIQFYIVIALAPLGVRAQCAREPRTAPRCRWWSQINIRMAGSKPVTSGPTPHHTQNVDHSCAWIVAVSRGRRAQKKPAGRGSGGFPYLSGSWSDQEEIRDQIGNITP